MGTAAIIGGILIGYFFTRTDVHLLSGILIGLGVGWTITGKFISHPRARKAPIKSNS